MKLIFCFQNFHIIDRNHRQSYQNSINYQNLVIFTKITSRMFCEKPKNKNLYRFISLVLFSNLRNPLIDFTHEISCLNESLARIVDNNEFRGYANVWLLVEFLLCLSMYITYTECFRTAISQFRFQVQLMTSIAFSSGSSLTWF